ncbi:MAG: hypothetical protein Kow0081_4760 [Candidatus Dojkabacteria bacterium]
MSKKIKQNKLYSDREIYKSLERYGLSDNEINVYTTALQLEKTSPYELSKLTGIPRTTVYDVITDLSLKGLVKIEKNNGFTKQQTRIRAVNPSELRKKIRERHSELYSLEVDIVEVLPRLKGEFFKRETDGNFEFIKGIDGAREVYFADEDEGIDVPRYVIDNLMPMESFGMSELNRDIDKQSEVRVDRNPIKVLVQMSEWCKHVISYHFKRNPNYLKSREYRYIDSPLFNVNERITICGNRVYISHASGDEAWGIKVKSEGYYKTMYSIFSVLWNTATPVTEEMVISWGTNKFLEAEMLKKRLTKSSRKV